MEPMHCWFTWKESKPLIEKFHQSASSPHLAEHWSREGRTVKPFHAIDDHWAPFIEQPCEEGEDGKQPFLLHAASIQTRRA
ncbi:hypothetical protein Dimus_013804, partial [Dionaea muscipula]